jgi:hypothetical protein
MRAGAALMPTMRNEPLEIPDIRTDQPSCQDITNGLEHTSCSNTTNRPSNNQGRRSRCDATDQAADLKDEHSEHVDKFDRPVLVRFAPDALKGRDRHEEARAIPANVVDRAKFIRDAGDCSTQNGSVERDQKDGEAAGNEDEGKAEAGRIDNCFIWRSYESRI